MANQNASFSIKEDPITEITFALHTLRLYRTLYLPAAAAGGHGGNPKPDMTPRRGGQSSNQSSLHTPSRPWECQQSEAGKIDASPGFWTRRLLSRGDALDDQEQLPTSDSIDDFGEDIEVDLVDMNLDADMILGIAVQGAQPTSLITIF